jgi:hypothetical protein
MSVRSEDAVVRLGQLDSLSVEHQTMSGPGSVVSIATSYGLDGSGIESQWGGEIFRTCQDRP